MKELLNPGGEKTVYIENIFIINFVMDCYLLILVNVFLKQRISCKRIAISASIGAAGYCLILILQMFFTQILGNFVLLQNLLFIIGINIFGAIMIKITCRPEKIRELLLGMGYLFTTSFVLGGFILFIRSRVPMFEEKCGFFTFIIGVGFLGFSLYRPIVKKIGRKEKNSFCVVELAGDNGPVKIQALIDTGNGLIEPISHKPVAILSNTVWASMQSCKRPEKFKVIPYHSIGKEKGMLEGYEIEGISVKGEIGWIRHENVILAVSEDKISGKDCYQMILPPELGI